MKLLPIVCVEIIGKSVIHVQTAVTSLENELRCFWYTILDHHLCTACSRILMINACFCQIFPAVCHWNSLENESKISCLLDFSKR